MERGTSTNGFGEVIEHRTGYHDSPDDLDDSESVLEDEINENSSRTGATEVIPRSADVLGASGRSSPAHSLAPIVDSNRSDSGSPSGCYSNTGFSLDEIIELRAGPRQGSVDARFPVQLEGPGNREDENSVLDSECFLATSSIVGDADLKINSTVGKTDQGMSSAIGRTDPAMSSDLASDSRVPATDSDGFVYEPEEKEEHHSRNLIRAGSNRSHASGTSFQMLEGDSSVFEEGHASFQVAQLDTSENMGEAIAVRRQSSVDRMLAMKEVLWKLGMNQLMQGEWKKIARHWQFTDEQIRAIEHQYTGNRDNTTKYNTMQ